MLGDVSKTVAALGVLAVAGCAADADRGLVDDGGIPAGTTTVTGGSATTVDPPGTDSADDGGGSGGPPRFDVGGIPDGGDGGPVDCIECNLMIDSQQSGVFDVTGANIFGTALLQNQVVYALGTHGAGRFVATADSSLPFNEQTNCPLLQWLAGTMAPDPAVLWFGWTQSDGPANWMVANGTAAGVHLPPQYIGNPALLAQDFDIVMYLEASGQFDQGDQPSNAEVQTILDYVAIHGGGVYVSSEFADPNGSAYLNPTDLASVNRFMLPLGVESLRVSLNWGGAVGNVAFDCFPTPAG